MFKFDGTSFNSFYTASYETDYGYTQYFLDGEEVGSSSFEDEGYKVALFDGNEKKYDENAFKVVFVQRSSKNKSSISSQPEKTEKVIQKLNSAYTAE